VRCQVLTAAVFWDFEPCHHQALMMEAASTSETTVNFYQTARRNNPEDSRLQLDLHM
jgi:hypothetical protein